MIFSWAEGKKRKYWRNTGNRTFLGPNNGQKLESQSLIVREDWGRVFYSTDLGVFFFFLRPISSFHFLLSYPQFFYFSNFCPKFLYFVIRILNLACSFFFLSQPYDLHHRRRCTYSRGTNKGEWIDIIFSFQWQDSRMVYIVDV